LFKPKKNINDDPLFLSFNTAMKKKMVTAVKEKEHEEVVEAVMKRLNTIGINN